MPAGVGVSESSTSGQLKPKFAFVQLRSIALLVFLSSTVLSSV